VRKDLIAPTVTFSDDGMPSISFPEPVLRAWKSVDDFVAYFSPVWFPQSPDWRPPSGFSFNEVNGNGNEIPITLNMHLVRRRFADSIIDAEKHGDTKKANQLREELLKLVARIAFAEILAVRSLGRARSSKGGKARASTWNEASEQKAWGMVSTAWHVCKKNSPRAKFAEFWERERDEIYKALLANPRTRKAAKLLRSTPRKYVTHKVANDHVRKFVRLNGSLPA
jgi:hypothetical protein